MQDWMEEKEMLRDLANRKIYTAGTSLRPTTDEASGVWSWRRGTLPAHAYAHRRPPTSEGATAGRCLDVDDGRAQRRDEGARGACAAVRPPSWGKGQGVSVPWTVWW